MKRTTMKLLSILLLICMMLQYIPAAVFATETELPDNDTLFAMYVEQVLYDNAWSLFGTAARENLDPVEQAIYDALKTNIETVAAAGGSAVFALSDISGLKTEWTREELGVESIEDTAAVKELFAAQFSLDRIVSALLSDCPFDLYWYDKTEGSSIQYSIGLSGMSSGGNTYWTKATINDLTVTFKVAAGYQGGDSTTVTSDVAKVSTAKAKAQSIVAEHEGKTDYEKLAAYKTTICDLVAYNDDAAADDYTGGYGDPWQLIYVFDEDTATTVVCEGYAKAFQYLCDLGGLDCISVTGVMSGGTGAGGHMWNIVTLDGENYLVDVTNCDEGTVGAPDGLFLVGNAEGSVADGYAFDLGGQTISFVYDAEMLSTWTESELTLAASDYEPVCAHTGGTATCEAKAVCQLCGSEYGELADHAYEDGVCAVCGTIQGAVRNAATGAAYATVADALADAGAGETVELLTDCADSEVVVYPSIILDLKGHKLTVSNLVSFETANVIDTVGTGKLIAVVGSVVLDKDNRMLPVYDGEGYIFVEAGFAIRLDAEHPGTGIKIDTLVYPLRMDVVELLKDGGANNDVQIQIQMCWDTDQGTGSQNFVFTEDVVSQVYTSNQGEWNMYEKMFSMYITGLEEIENLRANVAVVSGTDVKYVCANSVTIS